MVNKLKQDATPSIAGTIYQFYIAIDKCFELTNGEKLFIEKYGDISISGNKQIEVKKYETDLTDLHPNLWNTINNWLREDFNPNFYKELILLTTQDFSINSSLKNWNEKKSEEKKSILSAIADKFSKKEKKGEDTAKLIEPVLDSNKSRKLDIVLNKFSILDSSPKEIEYYNLIIEKHGKGVFSANREDFINSLLGFIISPKVVNQESWELSYDDFTAKVEFLTAEYSSKTIIFPKKYSTLKINDEDIKEKHKHLFIKKIEDIEYDEVKISAITDYIKTNKTITEELSKYFSSRDYYDGYEEELKGSFEPQYGLRQKI